MRRISHINLKVQCTECPIAYCRMCNLNGCPECKSDVYLTTCDGGNLRYRIGSDEERAMLSDLFDNITPNTRRNPDLFYQPPIRPGQRTPNFGDMQYGQSIPVTDNTETSSTTTNGIRYQRNNGDWIEVNTHANTFGIEGAYIAIADNRGGRLNIRRMDPAETIGQYLNYIRGELNAVIQDILIDEGRIDWLLNRISHTYRMMFNYPMDIRNDAPVFSAENLQTARETLRSQLNPGNVIRRNHNQLSPGMTTIQGSGSLGAATTGTTLNIPTTLTNANGMVNPRHELEHNRRRARRIDNDIQNITSGDTIELESTSEEQAQIGPWRTISGSTGHA